MIIPGSCQDEVTLLERKQSVNSLWPNDTIRRHRSGSTLAQVMACCLTAPSHYLNQCWLIISKVLYHLSEDLIKGVLKVPMSKASLKIEFLKLHPNPPGANELIVQCWLTVKLISFCWGNITTAQTLNRDKFEMTLYIIADWSSVGNSYIYLLLMIYCL